uniref:DRBM domain-containing protein n=1 Tax=Onchocerca volvulus TaxID=6282 RepID=A0A8R1TMD4_ONCVO
MEEIVIEVKNMDSLNGSNHCEGDVMDIAYLNLRRKIAAALEDTNSDGKSFTEKLGDLIKLDDEYINKIYVVQELRFLYYPPDLDGNLQCVLTLNGPNHSKNSFYGFGKTAADAKNFASFNAIRYLESFLLDYNGEVRNSCNSTPDTIELEENLLGKEGEEEEYYPLEKNSDMNNVNNFSFF